jgi:PTH1 family peptidyl-tRNA hydrolase
MKLLVGLGNPGPSYERHRHNVGFRAAQRFADAHRIALDQKKFGAVLGLGEVSGERVAVLLPQTFMNASGESVGPALRFYKAALADVIVVHDELDLPFGQVRVKTGGGHAGHNGLRSLVQHLGGADFVRLRVGISRPPPQWDPAAYVLAGFTGAEEQQLGDVLARVVEGLDLVLRSGVQTAMNRLNRRDDKPDAPQKDPAPKDAQKDAQTKGAQK